MYSKFLGEPNSHKAHELLHTSFVAKLLPQTEEAEPLSPKPLETVSGQDNIAVLFATVGGSTEILAKRIFKELKIGKLNAQIWPMDAFNVNYFKKIQIAIILTCTFGDGELPPMSQQLYDWLNDQQGGCLQHLKYAVFGLGSSKYNNFNMAAKKFDFKLEGLAATRLIEVGLGDDRAEDGFNTALEPWLMHLYEDIGVEPPRECPLLLYIC